MLSVASWEWAGLLFTFWHSSPTLVLVCPHSHGLGPRFWLTMPVPVDLIWLYQSLLRKKAVKFTDCRSSLSNRILHITLTGSSFSASTDPEGKLLGNKRSIWFCFSSCCCQCCRLGHQCRWPHYTDLTGCFLCVCVCVCVCVSAFSHCLYLAACTLVVELALMRAGHCT